MPIGKFNGPSLEPDMTPPELGKKQSPDELNEFQRSRRNLLGYAGKSTLAFSAVAVSGGLATIAEAAQVIGLFEKDPTNKQLLTYWLKHRKLVESLLPTFKENIAFLESIYGRNSMPILTRAVVDMDRFNQLISATSGITDQVLLENRISLPVFKNSLKEMTLYWDKDNLKQTARRAYQENREHAQFQGFNQLPGLNNEIVEQSFKFFNSHWLRGNVRNFEYFNREERESGFQVAANAQGGGLDGVFANSERERVSFFKGFYGSDAELLSALRSSLSHELGHQHDWENSNTLTIPERIQLLTEMTRRLNAEDRVHFVSVENIVPQIQNLTSEQIKYRQAREYWANIVREFDLRPKELKKDHQNDYNLVKGWRELILSRYR